MLPYAFTVKKLGVHREDQSYDMYEEVLYEGTRCKRLPYGLTNGSERSYEFDSHGILHVHGIVLAPRALRYSEVFCPGYHIYMRVLVTQKDEERWRRYINKANITPEDFWEKQREYIAQQEMSYFKTHAIL